MQLRMLLLGTILLFPTSPTSIDSGKPKNGYWWADMSDTRRLGLVEGYVTGLSRAEVLLRQSLDFNNDKIVDRTRKKPVTSYLDFSEISYGQYIEGLDVFYSDYRNKRINFNVAILYVRDQVRGASQDELEKRLEGMRKGAVEPNYDER
jgi:hypothetical protein